jgi:sulfur carrier protein
MQVLISGETEEISPGITVGDYLKSQDINPRSVAVEINLAIIPRDSYDTTVIHEGDKIEVVMFMGGG